MAPPSLRRYRRRRVSRRVKTPTPPSAPAQDGPTPTPTESDICLLAAQLRHATLAERLERGKSPQDARLPTDVRNRRDVFRRISVDVLGPQPVTPEGNTHVLLVVCLYTRWTELWPIRNCEAPTVTTTLVDRVFSTFGTPEEIFTDGHEAFESDHFRERMHKLGAMMTSLPPVYPSGPEVERRDRKILDKLNSLVKDTHRWDKELQLYQCIYNTTANSLTEISPNALMFPPVSVLSEFLEASDYDTPDSEEAEGWDYETFTRYVRKQEKECETEKRKSGDQEL